MLDSLLERFHRGDRPALARLLTLIDQGHGEEIVARLGHSGRQARVVALTGSGGVGKSTLAGQLISRIREQGQTVAVLACDPQSPLSGGALLGDRLRIAARPADDGIFIRSLAAASGHGAVAQNLGLMVHPLEMFGFDVVLIETVGAGQGDTAVRNLADIVVLLLQPETGDDLQWEKAGLLEVADVVVIQKADLPGAESLEAAVRTTLGLTSGPAVPVMRVSGKTGAGVDELWKTVATLPLRRAIEHHGARDLLRLAQDTLAARFASAEASGDPEWKQLLSDWRLGSLKANAAVSSLWRMLERLKPSE